MKGYIHQRAEWPHYTYDPARLLPLLEAAVLKRGELFGRLDALGFPDLEEARLDALTIEIVKSSEIEGEVVDLEVVRSSVANRLGVARGGIATGDHYVEGLVEMALDATQNHAMPLTVERIFNWHRSLFPYGRNSLGRVRTGEWRDDAKGPMQVVSGAGGREKVHFEAPPAARISHEMDRFLSWFAGENVASLVLKAGIAHLWFETIHPFEDGNGRIGRNILDMALCRADQRTFRCYSVSSQIRNERKGYYAALERAQSGDGDYTSWLEWFLCCFAQTLDAATRTVHAALDRTRFWQAHAGTRLNARQQGVVSRMLMGFEGRMTNRKYSKLAKCSDATASRDLNDLVSKGLLARDGSRGRSAGYIVRPVG